ncbi:MAG: hypothetical protein ACFFBS_09040, partial [Promethearchaeota archaeon]
MNSARRGFWVCFETTTANIINAANLFLISNSAEIGRAYTKSSPIRSPPHSIGLLPTTFKSTKYKERKHNKDDINPQGNRDNISSMGQVYELHVRQI